MHAAALGDAEVDVDRQVLVRAEVVNNPPAPLAIDHRGVEATAERLSEVADPGDRLATEAIAVRVIPDREGHVSAALREHDPPPGADVEERDRIRESMPHALHDTGPDRRDPIGAR